MLSSDHAQLAVGRAVRAVRNIDLGLGHSVRAGDTGVIRSFEPTRKYSWNVRFHADPNLGDVAVSADEIVPARGQS